MKNIEMRREGSKLIVEIDLNAQRTPSSSGKTEIIGTTSGNADIPGTKGAKIGINCYAYPNAELSV